MRNRPRVEFEWAEIGCLTRRRYFCGRCDRGCYHLYSHWSGAFLCRWCAHQVNLKPAARRFAKIEQFMKRLGVGRKSRRILVDPFPAPIPPPPKWSRGKWYRIAHEIMRLEAAVYDELDERESAEQRFALMLARPKKRA
jgi:hypothetical protein